MHLLLDIGNSTVVVAAADAHGNIVGASRFKTLKCRSAEYFTDNISSTLDDIAAHLPNGQGTGRQALLTSPSSIFVSSVVPEINDHVTAALRSVTGLNPRFLTLKDVSRFLTLDVDEPGKVGSDRLADAVGALVHYGSPVIVFDMGTATTVGVVTDGSTFVGGMIMPGIKTSLRALQSETSLLPSVDISEPPSVIGTNTIHCMQSGIVYGNACMVDGIIDRISRHHNTDFTVVATGGMAKHIVPYCSHTIILDNYLQLKGLLHMSRI